MDLGAFAQYLRRQRLLIDYTYISGTTVFIYNYLLTLHLEIKFIWFSRWTYTTILFVVIRYMALVSTVLLLHNQLFPDLTEQNCKAIFPATAWAEVIQIILAEIVITIRTWAVWHRHKVIGGGLGALFLGSLIFTCVVTSRFLTTVEYAPPPYPGYRGCFFTAAATRDLWPIYICVTATSSITLTLMGISAFRSYRSGHTSKLSYIIHRDGILFYFYLLCITATDMAVKVAAPSDMNYLMDPLLGALYPVFVSHIVLNIRQAGNRGSENELHSGYNEPIVFAMPLQFVSAERSMGRSALA